MAYCSREFCRYVNGSLIDEECTTDYEQSDVKYVIDNWAKNKINFNNLSVDSTGYSARLITVNELEKYLGYASYYDTDNVPEWVTSVRVYWTMSKWNDKTKVLHVNVNISSYNYIYSDMFLVRPVITLKKSAL